MVLIDEVIFIEHELDRCQLSPYRNDWKQLRILAEGCVARDQWKQDAVDCEVDVFVCSHTTSDCIICTIARTVCKRVTFFVAFAIVRMIGD